MIPESIASPPASIADDTRGYRQPSREYRGGYLTEDLPRGAIALPFKKKSQSSIQNRVGLLVKL